MLNTVLTIPHIPRPPIQNLRCDNRCGSYLLGDHNSELTAETIQTQRPTDSVHGQLVVAIFNCNPINAYWDTQITNKACVNTLDYFLGTQIPNIIFDVVLMILPLPYIWQRHITLLTQKAGLLFVFALGGV